MYSLQALEAFDHQTAATAYLLNIPFSMYLLVVFRYSGALWVRALVEQSDKALPVLHD